MMNGAAERHNVVQERSYAFAVSIVRLSRQLKRAREYELASQLLRSGTSIGANVEEAQAAQSKPDFVAKMAVACKEARETGYWLRLIRDSEAAAPSEITPLLAEATTLIRLLTSIVKSGQESIRSGSSRATR
jgi:four helix bundle protein